MNDDEIYCRVSLAHTKTKSMSSLLQVYGPEWDFVQSRCGDYNSLEAVNLYALVGIIISVL